MKFALLIALLVAPFAQANELDNEKSVTNAQRLAAKLPQTLVVRKDAQGNVSVLHSNKALKPGAKLDDSQFVAVKNTDKQSELDNDSSTSGWYFYWNNYSYSYPTYYYYGYTYNYRPYYSYSYGYYNYYWYRWY